MISLEERSHLSSPTCQEVWMKAHILFFFLFFVISWNSRLLLLHSSLRTINEFQTVCSGEAHLDVLQVWERLGPNHQHLHVQVARCWLQTEEPRFSHLFKHIHSRNQQVVSVSAATPDLHDNGVRAQWFYITQKQIQQSNETSMKPKTYASLVIF